MALWQVKFVFLPHQTVGDVDIVPKDLFNRSPMGNFTLPSGYALRISRLLPPKKAWSDNMELWGDDKSDDFTIWREAGRIMWISVRIDVHKLDNDLLSGVLTLADEWGCVLVEARYRTVCRMTVQEFRAFIAGHPHTLAMKDPKTWLPILAEEVRRGDDPA